MTGADRVSSKRSGRDSGRVDAASVSVTALSALQGGSAPGSLATSGIRDSASPRPERRAGRPKQHLTPDRIARLQRHLSPRDRAILDSLAMHRFLTTSQLQQLHFSDHATPSAAGRICRRVLARLAELDVIEHLDRRIGGIRAGSAGYVWRVGLAGDQLLRQGDPDRLRARRKEPSVRNLEHWLAIADAHLTLLDLARSGQLELTAVRTEPECWRSYLGLAGNKQTLKPDLSAVTAAGEFEDHWFIEIDRATESLPTVLGKCAQYQAYRRSGQEQHDHGIFPLVVWVTTSEAQTDRLRTAIDRSPTIDSSLFRVCKPADFGEVIRGGAG